MKATVISKLFVLFLSTSLLSCFSNQGLPTAQTDGELTEGVEDALDHSDLAYVLSTYVAEDGNVNYAGLKADRTKLDSYLKMLKNNAPTDDWKVEQQLEYYINLYNAATLRLIIDNDIPGSIKDIGGLTGPWLKDVVEIGDKTLNLASLEKAILQKMGEPRIHFAINCASESCPKLQNEPFLASTMEAQLEAATREFMASDKNKISRSKLELSSIFSWYEKDFTNTGMTIQQYVDKYTDTMVADNATITYKDYDWSLNRQ